VPVRTRGERRNAIEPFGENGHRWLAIPHHFPRVVSDEGILMPNHIHGIIVIQGRGERHPTTVVIRDRAEFQIHIHPQHERARGMLGTPVWQRNHYEHVVRNDEQLKAIREYILANTALWDEKENNTLRPDCGHGKMAGKPWVT
jgi:hypothetical protein